jgi:hypothetical protein
MTLDMPRDETRKEIKETAKQVGAVALGAGLFVVFFASIHALSGPKQGGVNL